MSNSDCCRAGHPYTSESLRITQGVRHCRICEKIKAQVARDKKRGDRPKFKKAGLQTHCFRGHEFTEENTYYYETRWGRQRRCRECERVREEGRRAKGEIVQPTKTHCKNGHPLTSENVRFRVGGYFTCKACSAERSNQYNKQHRDKVNEYRKDQTWVKQERLKEEILSALETPTEDAEALLAQVKTVIW